MTVWHLINVFWTNCNLVYFASNYEPSVSIPRTSTMVSPPVITRTRPVSSLMKYMNIICANNLGCKSDHKNFYLFFYSYVTATTIQNKVLQ